MELTHRLKALNDNRVASFIIIFSSIFGLALTFLSSTSVEITEMGSTDFFLFEIMPVFYWVGLVLITLPLILGLLFLREKLNPLIILGGSLCLAISMRVTFPGPFPNAVTFSNDNAFYMGILKPWVNTGIDFATEGRYQHDFPLAFLTSYTVIKLGVSINDFFRWFPTIMFTFNYVLSFFLFKELFKNKPSFYASIAVLLFASASLKYFMPANYCPNSIGSFFFLLSLYTTILFYRKGWTIKAVIPPMVSTILLILSHHLTIVYFTVLIFGIAVAARFFQGKSNNGAELRLFFIAIFTYTLWWVYGHFVYPSFFINYVFTAAPVGTVTRVAVIPPFDLFTLALQPVFIVVLCMLGIFEYLNVKKPSEIVPIIKFIPSYIHNVGNLKLEQGNGLLLYTFGFSVIALLLSASFVITNLYSDRVLDVFLLGLYPLSAQSLMHFTKGRSKKLKVLVAIFFVLIIITSTYRYFRENQRALIT